MRELIHIEIKDKSALLALDQMRRAAINPRPLLLEIGEDLAATTKARFASSTAPDGSAWKKNSTATIARWVHSKGTDKHGKLIRRKGTISKDGLTLSKAGDRRWDSKKPLIGHSKMLSHTIAYQLRGNHALLVGSPMIYGSTQQFGAAKGEYGVNKRGGPIPWGVVPARPFLGLSAADTANIVALAGSYLSAVYKT
jgi:phage gpG-like protein